MLYLKKLLMYGGLEREDFKSLLPDAWKRNERDLKTYSLLVTVIFAGLTIANFFVHDQTAANRAYYIAMALSNGAIYACTRLELPKRPSQSQVLTYAFVGALYAFALRLSSIHTNMPAVTAIVLLFAVPFLVTDKPIRLIGLTLLVTVVMCAMSLYYKPADIARMDMWNSLSFAAVAIVMEVLQQRARFNSLAQARKVRYLSETDLLTGTKNRNRYEYRLQRYAERCRTGLACAYIDVNGLHELNDTQGHRAGDEMLQAVAGRLIERFGEEHTYRIGGDEFVCFSMDANEDETRRDMAEIAAALKRSGYNISVGVAAGEKEGLDVAALILAAEDEMYQAKRVYYETTGKDRRRR